MKLKGIIIGGENDESHPSKVRLFKNRPNMTFDDAGAGSDQEFNLVHDTSCTLEYKVKTVTFSSVHHLSLHFPSNFGEDQTRIYYIGLAGEFTAANRSKYFSPDKCFSLKIFPTGWGWSTACTRPDP